MKYTFGLLCSLWLISATSMAAVNITAGEAQTVKAGDNIDSIVVLYTDSAGSPVVDAAFTLNVKNTATGEAVVEPFATQLGNTDQTDEQGEITVIIKPLLKTAEYTFSAVLQNNPTEFIETYITVEPSSANAITSLDTERQLIPAKRTSAPFYFSVADPFGNIPPSTQVNFSLTNASNTEVPGLVQANVFSDEEGLVTTQVIASETLGFYTITASLADNSNVTARAFFTVISAVTSLPALGLGGQLLSDGLFQDNRTVSFNGGVAPATGSFSQEAVITSSETVSIKGVIEVPEDDIGQQADLVVVAEYKANCQTVAVCSEGILFMLNSFKQPRDWNGVPAELIGFQEDVTLGDVEQLDIYSGSLPVGLLAIYFGYRIQTDGRVVFNAMNPIRILVE